MKSKLTRTLFGSALLALLACQAMAEGKISSITTKSVGDGLQVQINGEDLSAPKIMRVMGGRSFMLEFDASLSSDPQWIRVEQGGVHYVQSVVFQSKPPKIRIHLRVDPNTKLDVSPDAKGYAVKVVNNDGPAVAVSATKESPSANPVELKLYREPEKLHKPVPAPTRVERAPVAASASKGTKLVSLDFVNTELVQILKALAMQSGVNIVTAPDVKGSLTVSLGNVRINEALDLVTSLANVKYTQVGNTYLVAGSTTAFRNYTPRAAAAVTKVVPLYSGEGTHIKGALAAQHPDVQFLLPSEKPIVALASADPDVAARAAAAGAQQQTPQQSSGASANNTGAMSPKDAYIVLTGSPDNVSRVTAEVKDADEQMCQVLGVSYPRTASIIKAIYHPKGESAATLLAAFAMSQSSNTTAQSGSGGGASGGTGSGSAGLTHARVKTVELYATPLGSVSAQAIVLNGRETEVNEMLSTLESMDTLTQGGADYAIYEVKYANPQSLREDLITQFPGLAVTIPPGSNMGYNQYQADELRRQASERGTTANGGQSGTAAATAASGNKVTLAADTGDTQGLQQPFASEEAYAVPMRLTLRGNREQIQNAISYLAAVDTAPRQVALDLRVMELTKEDALRVGLDWSILTGGTVQSFRLNQGMGDTAASPGTVSTALGFAGGGAANILGTLDAIGNKNKVLARPNLLAIDGRQSEIFVGDVIRYIESIQATQNGTTVTTGQVPVGVRLAVLPRVGADGTIALDIRPVVSQLNGFTPVPGGGSLPQTSLRIAQSTMLVHSGDTIAIGGLIQDQDIKSRSGIPILKDLPILGLLFGRTNNDHRRTEIVFFLTAKEVDNTNKWEAANPMKNKMKPAGPGDQVGH